MNIRNIFFIFISGMLAAVTFSACGDYTDPQHPKIEFIKQASLPGNGRSSAVGFAINGKGYVALGKTEIRSGYLNDCWEYNPDSDKWTAKANFPGLPRVKAMAAVVKGKAYVGLGFEDVGVYQNIGYLQDFWMYDPETDMWTQKADFPGHSTDACVSFTFQGNVYVGSGFDGKGFQRDFWKYNPNDNSWTELNGFPSASRAGATICTNGEHVYFGTGYRTFNMADWWEYFPISDSWKQLNGMPDNGRENAVSLCVNNRFFVSTGQHFGGTLTTGHVFSDILEYDAIHNKWFKRGEIPNGSRANAISFTINGKGYIGFGETFYSILNDFYSFEP
jgi:N-acetylneuraminic acid mutarotase